MHYYYIVYPVVITLSMILSLASKDRKLDGFFIYFITISFASVVGFRSITAGSDTNTYAVLFDSLQNFSDVFWGYMSWKGDYFFSLISFFIKLISDNYHVYFFLLALSSLFLLNYSLKRLYLQHNVKNIYLHISIFYLSFIPYLLYGNVIRQGLSTSLIFLALSLYRRSLFLFYLIVFLAIFSHKSAFVFLFLPLFTKYPSKYKFLIVSISLLLFRKVIMFFLLKNSFIGTKILEFSTGWFEIENIVMIITFLAGYLLIYNKKLFSIKLRGNLLFEFFQYVLIISVITLDSPKLSGRFILYLMPIVPYIILQAPNFYKEKELVRLIVSFAIIIIGVLSPLLPAVQHNIVYNF